MAWTNKTGVNLGVGKPATTGLWNKTWDNLVYLYDLLFSHQHNGADGTALIEVGPNLLRNGSFESGTTSAWTPTTNTGGTVVVQTGNAMHGKYCLAITSTVLANGGGSALSDEYLPVAPGVVYTASMSVKGSVANISSKIGIVWYNSAQAQISESTVQESATLTTAHRAFVAAVAPATAAYARVKVYGGVPAVGTATGTIYIDGAQFVTSGDMPGDKKHQLNAGTAVAFSDITYRELLNARIARAGVFRISWTKDAGTGGGTNYTRIYRNGSAYGTEFADASGSAASRSEDLYFDANDTVQIFAHTNNISYNATVSSFAAGTCSGELPAVLIVNGVR